MRTTLGVLVIVVLTAWIGANVEEFSEKALENGFYYFREGGRTLNFKVAITNPFTELKLHGKPEIIDEDTILFNAKLAVSPSLGDIFSSTYWDPYHHIILGEIENEFAHFKQISNFGFKITKSKNGKTYIEIIILFTHSKDHEGLVLVVPVFERPAGVTLTSMEELDKTAKVGLSFPFTPQRLRNIFESQSPAFNMVWLKEVLEYKIQEADIFEHIWICATRPVVLRKDIIEAILEVANYYLKLDTMIKKKAPTFSSSFVEALTRHVVYNRQAEQRFCCWQTK